MVFNRLISGGPQIGGAVNDPGPLKVQFPSGGSGLSNTKFLSCVGDASGSYEIAVVEVSGSSAVVSTQFSLQYGYPYATARDVVRVCDTNTYAYTRKPNYINGTPEPIDRVYHADNSGNILGSVEIPNVSGTSDARAYGIVCINNDVWVSFSPNPYITSSLIKVDLTNYTLDLASQLNGVYIGDMASTGQCGCLCESDSILESAEIITYIDNVPLYAKLEHALLWGGLYKLEGYHTHEFEGRIGYMAGTDHNNAVTGETSTQVLPDPNIDMQLPPATYTPPPVTYTPPPTLPTPPPTPSPTPPTTPTPTPPTTPPPTTYGGSSGGGGGGY